LTGETDKSTVGFPDELSINEIFPVDKHDEIKLSILLYDNDQTVETLALLDSGAKEGNFIDQKFLDTHHIPYH